MIVLINYEKKTESKLNYLSIVTTKIDQNAWNL